eukprot:TRINITY_DN8338_c0_g1_i1.p1 TRINITY_DN8338_c0_g1~~TRINITY_DN8338_c0_g1_i1.p1  ORF type:complete len:371 (-),score=61.75 TRINITY_DN8338_c0_g1_i1:215-1327(-)
MQGHSEAVLSVQFSPDGSTLASGSGDTTVRIWDLNTETPEFTLKGHSNWVLVINWSPCGQKIASGGMDNEIKIWEQASGWVKPKVTLKGHTKWINAIAWEPIHRNPECSRIASASKDGTIKIWDLKLGRCSLTISGHAMSVTCLKWCGDGLLVSGSQDRSIRVFTDEGKLVRILDGHGHWINSLALHTDYALRCGPYDPLNPMPATPEEKQKKALEQYQKVLGNSPERLVSASDDFTLYLWTPSTAKKPIARLTGHSQPVNLVSYSPDGRYIASASFDKSIKLWDGVTGGFLATFRGHVGSVYQVCWSADSRLLVSGSKDSTLKVWDLKTKKLFLDLPGHADEVYAVDWSPDGMKVASGSKDRLVKIWKS